MDDSLKRILEDFDPEDVEWIDITTAHDEYYIEMAVNRENLYRHKLRLGGTNWIKGRPDG